MRPIPHAEMIFDARKSSSSVVFESSAEGSSSMRAMERVLDQSQSSGLMRDITVQMMPLEMIATRLPVLERKRTQREACCQYLKVKN